MLANGSGETLTLSNLNTPLDRPEERSFMRELSLELERIIASSGDSAHR